MPSSMAKSSIGGAKPTEPARCRIMQRNHGRSTFACSLFTTAVVLCGTFIEGTSPVQAGQQGTCQGQNNSTLDFACSHTGLSRANDYLDCELFDASSDDEVLVVAAGDSTTAGSDTGSEANRVHVQSQCLGSYFKCMGVCSSAEERQLEIRMNSYA